MRGRAFLHVGSPKTGTTFLQAVIWRSRGELENVGVRVPGASRQKHFQAALDVRGAPQRARFPEKIDGAWGRLLAAADGWSGDLLISHELLAASPQDRARAAIGDLAEMGYEPHVILTARDLARQLPAEWQERIKHRSTMEFGTFMARARDPESQVSRRLWAAQDYADILERWAGGLPREQAHLITVPPPGAPRGLLWERFAGVLGLDAGAFSIDVPRENTSLGLEQAVLLQQVNRRLGDRVPFPGAYTDVGVFLLAHQILGVRPGTPLALGGDDLEFARQRSADIVDSLRGQSVTVHGDLAELLVPEDLSRASSSARETVDDAVLLGESLETVADLMASYADRIEAGREEQARLQEDLDKARADLRHSRGQVAELERRLTPLTTKAARRVKAGARATSKRVKQLRRHRRPRVCFLVFTGDGIGGVARTTLTVANALADHYDVEVLSVYRNRGKPTFELDPRVKLTYLVHAKPRNPVYPPHLQELASQPTVLSNSDNYSAASDAAMRSAFEAMQDGDILISTRPSLHPSSLLLAPEKRLIRIGWDHLNFPTRYSGPHHHTGRSIDRAMPGLDAFVVLTEADAADYRRRHPGAHLEVIRNAVPWSVATERPPHDQKVVMAAGRLSEVKGYERLIEAWSLIQEEFPDWTCRIYGKGALEGSLRAQAEASGAAVELPGYTTDMRAELGRSALFAMSSRVEGFPMTLIEALSEGTPLVSFDCPRGPGEIVVDGSNGLLVPDGDIPGLAKALATLMRDDELRDRMGEQALVDAQQYQIENIAEDWVRLIEELRQERRG